MHMRRLFLVLLIGSVGLATSNVARAQTATPQQTTTSTPPLVATASPVPADPQTPQTAQQQPAAAAAPAAEEPKGLFDQTWHQFQLGGRFTSVNGDEARFQRYQDMRDGVLFTDFRYAKEAPDGTSTFHAKANNVGFRDQEYFANYERIGKFKVDGSWQGIPQFYSVDTATPYSMTPSPLLLPDATQQLIQNGQATISAWVPLAPQFDLTERRDVGHFGFIATPTTQLDINGSFTATHHVGSLPWGESFGFSNNTEIALPYDSRTNELNLGTEWTNGHEMLRVGYDGSWFSHPTSTLVFDNPARLTDSATSGPGAGQAAFWPSNNAQTISAGGFAKFSHRTQVTGFLSFGFWNNNEALLPFTDNTALTQLPLPRPTAEAGAHIFSGNVNLVTRPKTDWQFTAHLREYNYSNQTPPTAIPQYVSYDTSISASPTGAPLLFAHGRTTFDADATYTGMKPLALTAGYGHNNNSYDFRTFASTGENILRLSADTTGSQLVTFRAKYELADRNGSNLDTSLLTTMGEQTQMRQYDIANRTRNQFTGQVDFTPTDKVMASVSGGVGKDNYPDSYFGLQSTTFRTFSLGLDYTADSGLGVGGTYNLERYEGLQQSRSAKSDPLQFNDPLRNWTADSTETVNYFSIYITPPKFGPNTEARLSYDFSYAEGNYLYTVAPGGPLPPPSQLPKVYNKLQQLHIDVRHRLNPKMVLDFSYLYEPFRVYDFAFDPSVINGIAQPSTLVLGYVYRPYTANSGTISLRYLF
jgi:MtrB/PioB family decaheme-associated outer membrane protein